MFSIHGWRVSSRCLKASFDSQFPNFCLYYWRFIFHSLYLKQLNDDDSLHNWCSIAAHRRRKPAVCQRTNCYNFLPREEFILLTSHQLLTRKSNFQVSCFFSADSKIRRLMSFLTLNERNKELRNEIADGVVSSISLLFVLHLLLHDCIPQHGVSCSRINDSIIEVTVLLLIVIWFKLAHVHSMPSNWYGNSEIQVEHNAFSTNIRHYTVQENQSFRKSSECDCLEMKEANK